MIDLEKFFDEHRDEYLKFDRIRHYRSGRRDAHAFSLLDELVPSEGKLVSGAECGNIFLDVDCETLSYVASESSLIELIRCGVWYNSKSKYLYISLE